MQRINLDEDVRPVSEFRQNAAKFVQQVRTTRRPLVLTQHGKSAAVLLDVGEYERLVESLAVVQDVARAERQIEAGEVFDHDDVFEQLLSEYPE
jgi:prevent-host-death family protein